MTIAILKPTPVVLVSLGAAAYIVVARPFEASPPSEPAPVVIKGVTDYFLPGPPITPTIVKTSRQSAARSAGARSL